MLDRGQNQDWFSSREIIIEAVLAGLGFYLFIVHMFTAERPFLPPGLFKDRNFVCGVIDGVLHRHGDAGEFRADGALSGEPGGLSGRDRGLVDGAARDRHHASVCRSRAGSPTWSTIAS